MDGGPTRPRRDGLDYSRADSYLSRYSTTTRERRKWTTPRGRLSPREPCRYRREHWARSRHACHSSPVDEWGKNRQARPSEKIPNNTRELHYPHLGIPLTAGTGYVRGSPYHCWSSRCMAL